MLVTGAAAGLARGVAIALAGDGYERIAITYRATPPDQTLRELRDAGVDARAFCIDFLADAADVAARLEQAVEESGPFDVVVHGVGPMVIGPAGKASADDYREMFDGNVRSALLVVKAVLPSMRERGFGRVVFFGMNGSSVARGARNLALHAAAKSALVAFARSLALEEAPFGITVNVVEPGDIRDKTIDRSQARERTANNPRGRPGSWEDVADAVRFFVAPQRDFVTGAVLAVDGGLRQAIERNAPLP